MEELEEVFKKSRQRKSPGIYGICVELLKYGDKSLKKILILFNNIWKYQRIPKEWETGIVINVHKKGPKEKCENYRGITLLTTASKLYANILKNKLIKFTEDYLEEEQYGFRRGRGSTDATFTIQLLEKRKEFNLPIFLLLIDYKKSL
jgi:sorting nexin-29